MLQNDTIFLFIYKGTLCSADMVHIIALWLQTPAELVNRGELLHHTWVLCNINAWLHPTAKCILFKLIKSERSKRVGYVILFTPESKLLFR